MSAASGSIVVIAATMGTAAVVSVSGLIGFVGIDRAARRADVDRCSLPPGAAAQRDRRRGVPDPRRHPRPVLQDPAETPIGVVTAFFGAPFFIVVLRSKRTCA